jgi:Tfp pilus assembly protein PilN
MLRINLLPVKAARRSQMGKRQILLFFVILIVFIGLLSLMHVKYVKQDTGDLADRLAKLKKQTAQLRAKTGNVSRYKRLRRKYRKRRKAYKQVLGGCYCRCSGEKKVRECTSKCGPAQKMLRFCPGPVLVMRELSRVLSERWGPSLKSNLDPSRRAEYYNPNWDPSGLWVERWEEQNGEVIITGGAKANGDVAEFEKRLKASRYFADVSVQKTTLKKAKEEKLSHYEFQLSARVRY